MFYPQQSPAVAHKHPSHHDQSPWSRTHHPVLGPPASQNIGPPPASPGFPLYTNGSVNPMQHHPAHPHALSHPPIPHHQHQNSLSHYPSPPNGHIHTQHMGSGSPGSAASQIISPHWQQQLLKCEVRSQCMPCSCDRSDWSLNFKDDQVVPFAASSCARERHGLSHRHKGRYPYHQP